MVVWMCACEIAHHTPSTPGQPPYHENPGRNPVLVMWPKVHLLNSIIPGASCLLHFQCIFYFLSFLILTLTQDAFFLACILL